MVSNWTTEPAARQEGGGGDKAPHCGPFHLRMGQNSPNKRHQRKVLLEVSITIGSLERQPADREAVSIISEVILTLIRTNGAAAKE